MRRLLKSTVLLGLATILLMASVVSACGGGGAKAEKTVVLGWIADETGPSASTFTQIQMGMDDYIGQMDPIPGVKIEVKTYDSRLEPSRVPTGYQWLADQGTDILLHYDPNYQLVTADDQVHDMIPSCAFNVDEATAENEWIFGYSGTLYDEGKFIIDYLVKDWWETRGMTRPIKIGTLISSSMQPRGGYWQAYQDYAETHPGKCALARSEGSLTQTAWASEVGALKDNDVVIVGTTGTAAATFLKELYLRGFEGQVVGNSIAVLAVWPMLTSIVPKADMDGVIVPQPWPLWTDDNPFVSQMRAALEESRPSEAGALQKSTNWLTGYCLAHVLANAVRVAAENVGRDKVDGTALRDTLAETRLETPGMPTIGGYGNQCLNPCMRMVKYNASEDDWYPETDWVNVLQLS